MRFHDILRLALSALGQHRVRTALTTLGVLVACFLLISSVSVGRGIYVATMRQFRKGDSLRQISVTPSYEQPERTIPAADIAVHGSMSDAKRERIRTRLIWEYNRRHPHGPRVLLTVERLRHLRALDHVERVVPYLQRGARASLEDKPTRSTLVGAISDTELFRDRLLAGDFFTSDQEKSAIVGEYLLYRWGLVSDGDVVQAIGKKIRLQYRTAGPNPAPLSALLNVFSGANVRLTSKEKGLLQRTARYLPQAARSLHLDEQEVATLQRILAQLPGETGSPGRLHSAEFIIRGIVRETTKDDDRALLGFTPMPARTEVFLPVKTAEAFLLHGAKPDENEIPQATVVVDNEDNLRSVIAQVEAMGLKQWSFVTFVDRVRLNLTLVLFMMTFLATVALLVSALGITNTMFMSVLERTREIGIMKAVGARNFHVQGIFLIEGAFIGLVGGASGLLLSWLVSFPGDSVARSLMERQTSTHLHESLFLFPLWLTLGVPLFVVLVTTVAAVYPARRAAGVNPISALRYE